MTAATDLRALRERVAGLTDDDGDGHVFRAFETAADRLWPDVDWRWDNDGGRLSASRLFTLLGGSGYLDGAVLMTEAELPGWRAVGVTS